MAAAAVGVAVYYAEASGLHSHGLAPADRAQGSLDFARFPATFAEAPMLPVAIALAVVFHVLLFFQRRRLDSRAVLFFLASHLAVVVGTLVLARKGDSLLHQRFPIRRSPSSSFALDFALRHLTQSLRENYEAIVEKNGFRFLTADVALKAAHAWRSGVTEAGSPLR